MIERPGRLKRVNFSNTLTLVRIALLVPMGLCLVHGYNWTATIILALAGISDGLDGYFARKWNQVSDFGKLMIPPPTKYL